MPIYLQWLRIVQSSVFDSGKYICEATNIAGKTKEDVTLRVYVPPTIDRSNLISNPLGILGRDLWIDCPASGVPEPTIVWRMGVGGNAIPIDGKKYMLEQVIDRGPLGVEPRRMRVPMPMMGSE